MIAQITFKRVLIGALFFALALVQFELMLGVPSGWFEGQMLQFWCIKRTNARACYAWAKREDLSRDLINSVREAPTKAFEGYDRACKQDHLGACTDLSSWYIRKEKYDEAAVVAKKSCDGKDAVGCYNVACAYCRLKDKQRALEFLLLTQTLDAEMLGEAEAWKDPDLECLKEDPEFEKMLARFAR